MCLTILRSDVKRLKEHRADYECVVAIKEFFIERFYPKWPCSLPQFSVSSGLVSWQNTWNPNRAFSNDPTKAHYYSPPVLVASKMRAPMWEQFQQYLGPNPPARQYLGPNPPAQLTLVDKMKEEMYQRFCQQIEPVPEYEEILRSGIMNGKDQTYKRGKVYFDESDQMLRDFSFQPSWWKSFWIHRQKDVEEPVEYLTGYHARLANPKFEDMYHRWRRLQESYVPVMLAEITAIETNGHESVQSIVGRIMLIMTKEDHEQYMSDISTKPLDITENGFKVQPNHIKEVHHARSTSATRTTRDPHQFCFR